MFRTKKSQVTVFMIVGLILVISAAVLLYFKDAMQPKIDVIQPEIAPVVDFIHSCIDNAAEEGITTIGLNGGYITFPPFIEENPFSYLSNGPIKSIKNPYWWYKGRSAIPTVEFMQQQIDDYVTKELKICLNNFDSFKNDFDIKELGEITTATRLLNEGTEVDVHYPLEINSKLNRTTIKKEDYKRTIPIRVKRVYDLAKKIMEKEDQETFIEKKTMDLVALDPKIPLSSMDVDCNKKIWFIPNIKDKLKTLLQSNLPYIRIVGTKYIKNSYVPIPLQAFEDAKPENTYEKSYYQSHYLWDILEEDFKDTHVSFTYDKNWPLDMYVRPNKGQELTSNMQQGQDALKFFCLQIWKFTYDIEYPVKAAITDDETKDHNKYSFNFAFMTSVDHNRPNRGYKGTQLFDTEDIVTSEDYCAETKNEITLYTDDKIEFEPVTDVNLTFTCGKFTCDIGKTDWLGFGAASGLTKALPYCVTGIVKANKKGYKEAEMFIQAEKDGSFTIEMTPTMTFTKYSVVKHQSLNTDLKESLTGDYKASIMIKKDNSFENYGVYPSETLPEIELFAKEENTYDLEIYLIKGEDVVGGYKSKWTPSWDDMRVSNEIVFHVIEQSTSAEESDKFLFMSSLEGESKKVPVPEFK